MRLNPVGCLAVLLAGCGGLNLTSSNGGGGGGGSTPATAIAVHDNAYTPNVITIKVGTKVNWTNNGPSSHTVTSDSIGFDSGSLAAPNGLFQVTFTTPGTYTYHCSFHATTMLGSITVLP